MKRNFRELLETNKWLKKVPNALTICNSLCGFSAILYTLKVFEEGQTPEKILAVSAWIILFAMIFDALDGFAARIFNAASMHGLQMDSLADMVTFGVAPSVLVAVMYHNVKLAPGETKYLIWGLCGIYLGCAALRLATYNVHAILEKKSGDKFTGLPSPGAAAAVCSLVIFYSMNMNEGYKDLVTVLPFYAAVLGILMVSNIPYIHIGKWIVSVRRNKKRLFILFIILAAMFYKAEMVTVIIINAYVLSGPLIAIASKLGLLKKTSSDIVPLNIE